MRNRRKIAPMLIALFLLAAMGISGCGQPAPPEVPVETSAEETASLEEASVDTTTTTTVVQTTPAPAENPWVEREYSSPIVMYITKNDTHSISAPEEASETVKKYGKNQSVTVVAKTDNNYYKLEDGSFVPADLLSTQEEKTATTTAKKEEKPAVVTTAATTPAETEPAVTNAPSNNKVLFAEPTIGNVFGTPSGNGGVSGGVGAAAAPSGPTKEEMETFTDRVFELTNIERVKYGLPAFKRKSTLAAVASQRAKDISYYYEREHLRPNGEKWYKLMDRSDMLYGYRAENIAAGQTSPEEMVDAWMNSPVHRENILDPNFEYMEAGFYFVEGDDPQLYRYYWVQDFYGSL